MRKVLYRSFGGLEVLELAEVPLPEPGPQELRIRLMAAAVNPIDWKLREGQVKFLSGWRFPQGQGVECAGIVDKVGRGVAGYAVGDEVLGTGKGWNCLATFTLAKPHNIAKKPQAVPASAAAVIPCVGTTAASLFSRVAIGEGTHVLMNGAAGGIGMFATQMAVRRGATVTAVVSETGAPHVRRWGASRVIDYRTTHVLDEGHQYDVIADLSGSLSFRRAKRILKPGGTFVASLPNPAEFVPGFLGNLISSRKYALMGMQARTDVLASVASDVAAGHIDVVVSKTFPLEALREAYAHAAATGVVGEVVIVMGD